ncbi:MAG: 16S rRNA (cytidine(1402)-2'-O)-methyltransferase [Magnetococcales bacterium]|nr:16S rRNA (cytidine(1402)-2'-O)-methyltransferase [Magnetococcales bacterium]
MGNPPIGSVSVRCRGHVNLRASHDKTLEFIPEADLSPRGTCVVGVAAEYDAAALGRLRGPVRVVLESGGLRDELTAVVSPTFKPGDPLILRRHPQPQQNTFAHGASKSARDLDPALVARLADPASELQVTVEPLAEGERQGILYVVAMPIGNPLDLSPRAQAVLAGVDRILTEDTRSSAPLLKALGIRAPAVSCHEHNEGQRADQMAGWLAAGERIALISEAGTPGCSDPGYPVVRAAIAAGALVAPVPGPSAILAALAVSGLPSDRFTFVGFPPRTGSRRGQFFQELAGREETLVLFESPHRLLACLEDMVVHLGEREVVVARNLTKYNEAIERGTPARLLERFAALAAVRGEYTLVIGKGPPRPTGGLTSPVAELMTALLERGVAVKPLSQALATVLNMPRREAFERLNQLKSKAAGGGDRLEEEDPA